MAKGRRAARPSAGNHLSPELIALMRHVEAHRYDEVVTAARAILARRPNQPLAAKALSYAMVAQGRYEEALPILEHLAATQARDAEIHNNLGIAYSALMRYADSIASFTRSIALAPDDPETLKNLGAACINAKRWNEAVPWLLQAIEKHPGEYVEAVSLLAASLMNANRVDEAAVCFEELWKDSPADDMALFQLLYCSLRRCDWSNFEERRAIFLQRQSALASSVGPPLPSLAMPGMDAAAQRRFAELFATDAVSPHIYAHGAAMTLHSLPAPGERLRIAYLSADFRFHPVGFVVPDVIERHDRTRFEVIGYSTGADDSSDIRARLTRAFDMFVDLSNASIPETVERIRADKVDILIDLQGWTKDCRPEVLALRCAPVQVNWLGYAGTMGHRGLADYIIGDPVVTPLDDASFYTETIAQMPHCYLPFDAKRSVPSAPTRAAQGLPDSAFVFCSLNNNYKFNPAVFDLWCRLLHEVPGSVLWLSKPADGAAQNLKMEIERRGVAPERLCFAIRVDSPADHLARIQLADLALDTFPYNSHSSGMDTLWAGVPMVTQRGETFASRVGASLLEAAGLGELVAPDAEGYCAMALDLARNPEKLAELRSRLGESRAKSALFDMAAFTASLEDIFVRICDNARRGVKEPLPARTG